jgi:uncharacterized damage-inducible protein DinB
MSELQSIIDWYEYNSFVRRRYLKAIFEKIPEEERHRDRGASFPSIVDIFVHVLDDYRFWFQYVYAGNIAGFTKLRGETRFTFGRLAEENDMIDRFVLNFVRDLMPGDLGKEISAEGRRYGTVVRFDLRQMLLHMIEEELQHRGEMNALFWQVDIDPPVTEYMDWIYAKSRGLLQ